jgi:hypothetical protein
MSFRWQNTVHLTCTTGINYLIRKVVRLILRDSQNKPFHVNAVIRFFRCLRIIYEGLTAISKKSPQSKETLIQENIRFLKGGGDSRFGV